LRTLKVAVLTIASGLTLGTSLADGTPGTSSAHLTPETRHTIHTGPAIFTWGTPVTGLAVSAGSARSTPLARAADLAGLTALASGASSALVAWGTSGSGPAFAAHIAFAASGAHGAGPAWLTGSALLASRTLPAVLTRDTWDAVAAWLSRLAVGDVHAVFTVGSAVAGLAVDTVDALLAVGAVETFATGDTGLTLAAHFTLGLFRDGAVAFAGLVADGADILDVLLDAGLFTDVDGAAVSGDLAAVAEAVHGIFRVSDLHRHELVALEDRVIAHFFLGDQGRTVFAWPGGQSRAQQG